MMKPPHVEVIGEGGSFLIHPDVAKAFGVVRGSRIEGKELLDLYRASVEADCKDAARGTDADTMTRQITREAS